MRKRRWKQWLAGVLALAMLVTETPIVRAEEDVTETVTEQTDQESSESFKSDGLVGTLNSAVSLETGSHYDIKYTLEEGYYRLQLSDYDLAFTMKSADGALVEDATKWQYYTSGTYSFSIDIPESAGTTTVVLKSTNTITEGNHVVTIDDYCTTEYLTFVPETSGKYYLYSDVDADTFGYLREHGSATVETSDDDGKANNFRFEKELTAGQTYYIGVRFYSTYDTGDIDVRIETVHNYVSYQVVTNPLVSTVQTGEGSYNPDGLVINLIDSYDGTEMLEYGTAEWTDLETDVWYSDNQGDEINLNSLSYSGAAIRHSQIYDVEIEIPFTVTAVDVSTFETVEAAKEYVLEPGTKYYFSYQMTENSKLRFTSENTVNCQVDLYSKELVLYGQYASSEIMLDAGTYYFVVYVSGKEDETEDSLFRFDNDLPQKTEIAGELGNTYTLPVYSITTITYEIPVSGYYDAIYTGNCDAKVEDDQGNYHYLACEQWLYKQKGTYIFTICTPCDEDDYTFALKPCEKQEGTLGVTYTIPPKSVASITYNLQKGFYYAFVYDDPVELGTDDGISVGLAGTTNVIEQDGTYTLSLDTLYDDYELEVCVTKVPEVTLGSHNIEVSDSIAYFTFVPKKSAYYTFYSTDEADTVGTIHTMNGIVIEEDFGGEDGNFSITVPMTANVPYLLGVYYYSGGEGTIPVCIEKGAEITSCQLVGDEVKNSVLSNESGSYCPSNIAVTMNSSDDISTEFEFGTTLWYFGESNVGYFDENGNEIIWQNDMPVGLYYRRSNLFGYEISIPISVVNRTALTEGTQTLTIAQGDKGFFSFTPEKAGLYWFSVTMSSQGDFHYELPDASWSHGFDGGGNEKVSIQLDANNAFEFEFENWDKFNANTVSLQIERVKVIKSISLLDESAEWNIIQLEGIRFDGARVEIVYDDDTTETVAYGSEQWNNLIDSYTIRKPDESDISDDDYEKVYVSQGGYYEDTLRTGEYLCRYSIRNTYLDIPFAIISWKDAENYRPGEMVAIEALAGEMTVTKKLVIEEAGWYEVVFTKKSQCSDVYLADENENRVDTNINNVFYLTEGIYKIQFTDYCQENQSATIKAPSLLNFGAVEIPGDYYELYYYSIVPEKDTKYHFVTEGEWDPYIAVYEGTSEIYTDDNKGEDFNCDGKVILKEGVRYLFTILSRYGDNDSNHTLYVSEEPKLVDVQIESPLTDYPNAYHADIFYKTVFLLNFEDGSTKSVEYDSAEFYEYMHGEYTDYDSNQNEVSIYSITDPGKYSRHYLIDEKEFVIPFEILDWPMAGVGEQVTPEYGVRTAVKFTVEEDGAYYLKPSENASLSSDYIEYKAKIFDSNYYYLSAGNTYTYWFTLTPEESEEEAYVMLKPADELIGSEANVTVGYGETKVITFVPKKTGIYRIYSSDGKLGKDTYGYWNDGNGTGVENDDGNGNRDFLITQKMVAGEKYAIGVRFYYSSESGTIHLHIDKVKELESFEILNQPTNTEYCYPLATNNVDLSGLQIKKYYDNDTEELCSYGDNNWYADTVSLTILDSEGNSLEYATGQKLPAGTYACEITMGEDTQSFTFTVREADREIKLGEANCMEEAGKTYYFKWTVDDDTAPYTIIESSGGDFHIYDASGDEKQYSWWAAEVPKGEYYISYKPYFSEDEYAFTIEKMDALKEVSLDSDKIVVDAIFGQTRLNELRDTLLVTVTAESGFAVMGSFLGRRTISVYNYTYTLTDSEGREHSIYEALGIGTYTLTIDFDGEGLTDSMEIEVKEVYDYPEMEKNRKYTVDRESVMNYFSLELARDTKLIFLGNQAAYVKLYDIERSQFITFETGVIVPFKAGKYVIRIENHARNNEIRFEQVSSLTSVKETSDKVTEIEYGTWGYNIYRSVSDNNYPYRTTLTTPAKPNTILNGIVGATVVSGNNTAKNPGYTIVSTVSNNNISTGTGPVVVPVSSNNYVSGNNYGSGNHVIYVSDNNVPVSGTTEETTVSSGKKTYYVSGNYFPNKNASIYSRVRTYNYYVSGNLVSSWTVSNNYLNKNYSSAMPQIGFDWLFKTTDEEGETKSFSFNDTLWNIYDFVTKLIFNEDGTPAQTDANGYLAPGNYKVEVGNNDASTLIDVTVKLPENAIYVKEQPVDTVAYVGSEATFSVNVLGDHLKYQWQYMESGERQWQDVTDAKANSATLTIATGSDLSLSGRLYRCVVANEAGAQIVTNEVYLIVEERILTITKQPEAITAAPNERVTFSVEAEGEGLTYQWQFRNAGSPNWISSRITAALTANMTFVVGTDKTINGREYRCIVTDAYGHTAISEGAVLTVEAAGPEITSQPVDTIVTAGESVTFSVVAEGEGLTYQWQFQNVGSTTWSKSSIAAAKTANMTFVANESISGRKYRCIVTDAKGKSVTTDAAVLTVEAAGPIIKTQPADTTVAAGDKVTFSVVAEGTGLTYQWQFQNVGATTWSKSGIAEAKTANMTFVANESISGRKYRCIVTDAKGKSVTTEAAVLTVEAAGPTIKTQPVDTTVASGDKVTFSVVAEGTGLTYQWQFQNVGTTTWSKSGIAAAKTANMTFGTNESLSGRKYRCIVTDANGKSVTTDAAVLTVEAAGPKIKTQPVSVTVVAGTAITFSVAAEGTGLTYQWQFQNASATTWTNSGIKAAKTANMTFTANDNISGRKYRCVVTDANGKSTTSTVATLTVGQPTGPVITKQPTNVSAAVNTKVTFSVTAEGKGLTYQWYFKNATATTWSKSGIAAAKTANMTFVVGTDKSLNGREYRCVVTDANGKTVTSVSGTLTVK